jgi:hypothetical protein
MPPCRFPMCCQFSQPSDGVLRAGCIDCYFLQVKLKDVQSFYQEDGKSPFKHMPWKHGSMHFNYQHVRPDN